MDASQDLSLTTDRLLLRPSKLRWTAMLLGSAALALGGVWLIISGVHLDNPPFGIGDAHFWVWFGVILFALGIPISLAQMFSRRVYLELTPEGFNVGTLSLRTAYRWSAVGAFSTEEITYRGFTIGKRVVFDGVSAALEGHPRAAAIVNAIGGRLPDTYGMKADVLADLMNRWRSKHAHGGY